MMKKSGGKGDAVLVSGASRGLGFETALYLAEQGFTVFATVRDLNEGHTLNQEARFRRVMVNVVELDMDNSASTAGAVEEVELIQYTGPFLRESQEPIGSQEAVI